MIFFGMAVFALIQNRISSLKEQDTLAQLVELKSNEMQCYLAKIDRILPEDKIESDIYD